MLLFMFLDNYKYYYTLYLYERDCLIFYEKNSEIFFLLSFPILIIQTCLTKIVEIN